MKKYASSLACLTALGALGGTVPSGAEASDGMDLREGGVYSMSNARDGNDVVAFARAPNGTLTMVGSFPTGGRGSGSFEDTANGLVLGSADGEASPNNLIEDGRLLFATNAGSDTISVFRVERDGLRLVETQGSGGDKPVSVTVNGGLVYVLNSGEEVDDLFDENGEVITNCTTGERPTVTGFRVNSAGRLASIRGSTRLLSGADFSGCAQVTFSPDGRFLVVTEREVASELTSQLEASEGKGRPFDRDRFKRKLIRLILGGTDVEELLADVGYEMDDMSGDAMDDGEAAPDAGVVDEGVIVTFAVNEDGTLGERRIVDATGQGPFGFTFRKDGILLTTEQFDGLGGPGRGAAASYALNGDGTLEPRSGSVDNGGTDTCWFVVTDDGRLGFVTSFFGDGRISSYEVGPEGNLTLLEADAAGPLGQGASDIALSQDSGFLYQLNSFEGTINAFQVDVDGNLDLIQTVQAHEPSDMAARLGIAAF